MNILYGVNATGNGHLTRSRITISELKKRGHKVTVLFSGRDDKDFFDVTLGSILIAANGQLDHYVVHQKI